MTWGNALRQREVFGGYTKLLSNGVAGTETTRDFLTQGKSYEARFITFVFSGPAVCRGCIGHHGSQPPRPID